MSMSKLKRDKDKRISLSDWVFYGFLGFVAVCLIIAQFL